jgi:hypothetical protein
MRYLATQRSPPGDCDAGACDPGDRNLEGADLVRREPVPNPGFTGLVDQLRSRGMNSFHFSLVDLSGCGQKRGPMI